MCVQASAAPDKSPFSGQCTLFVVTHYTTHAVKQEDLRIQSLFVQSTSPYHDLMPATLGSAHQDVMSVCIHMTKSYHISLYVCWYAAHTLLHCMIHHYMTGHIC